jgi:myo-inositol-1(or 4)-monophosphatase
MPHYRTGTIPHDKGGPGRFDPVTVADRAGESVMRDLIMTTYPSHGIVGEEFGLHQEKAELVWVLDPIDGTKSFITGIPLWGTLIGVLKDGEPFLGLSNHPFLQERFWGDGKEARGVGPLGPKPLRTRKSVPLSDAVMLAGSSTILDARLDANWRALEPQVRMLRYGADCYDSNMLAEGHIDSILQRGLDIYDIAALVPIIKGAGGVVTGLDGGAAIDASTILSSGDRDLHATLLAALSR